MSRHECDCGAVYSTPAGAEACQINNHGRPRTCAECARKDAALREIEALRESAFSDTHSAFVKAKQVARSALTPARETVKPK